MQDAQGGKQEWDIRSLGYIGLQNISKEDVKVILNLTKSVELLREDYFISN